MKETLIPVAQPRYAVHRMLEGWIKKPGVDAVRDYLWAQTEMGLLVRAPEERGTLRWMDGYVPEAGEVVAFQLDARPIKKASRGRWADLPVKRVPLTDPADAIAWLRRKFTEESGLDLLEARSTPFQVVIDPADVPPYFVPPSTEGQRKRFAFPAVKFQGEARVVDADKLRSAMLRGLGEGKTYGLGLLQMIH